LALCNSHGVRLCGLTLAALVTCAGCAGGSDEPLPTGESAQVIELGRHLFFERRLSLEDNRSCGICHEPALGFSDGLVRAVGTGDQLHPRNSQGLANVGRREELTWMKAAADSLEEQLLVPLLGEHPVEMGMAGRVPDILEMLRADPVYSELFPAAYPHEDDPYTLDGVAGAIAAFERTLVSETAPFDRYASGDLEAISQEAERGLDLFYSHRLRCAGCHAGTDLDQPSEANELTARHGWFNTGLYDVDGLGAYPAGAQGRYEETGDPEDIGRFRTPSLRNVGITGPYYHDGSGANLADVIANYAAGGRYVSSGPNVGDGRDNAHKSGLILGFVLSDQEATDLEAFLHTLTDWEMVENPAFSDPWPRD
jgi:cytochrome c peroxidase